MADNFNMKKYLAENKLGAYSRLKEVEEGYMGTQYDSSEDMAVDMVKKGLPEEKVEEAGQGSLMVIERIEEIVNNLARNIATNSNIPTQEKLGLVQALKELKDLVEDLGADVEMSMDETKEPVKEDKSTNYNMLNKAWEAMLNDPNINSEELSINGYMNRLEYEFNTPKEKEYITQLAKRQGLDLSGSEDNKLYFSLPGSKQPTSSTIGGGEVPFTDKVKRAIDRAVASAKKDGEFDELVSAGYFDEELVDDLIDLFPNKDYDSASKEVMNYIAKVTGQMSESKKPVEEDMYDIDAQSFGGILKSDNPEGDALVLRFLKGIAKKFDYPVGQAALFVKERLKKLGY
jgi:hypothetical protein